MNRQELHRMGPILSDDIILTIADINEMRETLNMRKITLKKHHDRTNSKINKTRVNKPINKTVLEEERERIKDFRAKLTSNLKELLGGTLEINDPLGKVFD
ncbi:hypothetical protein KAI54_04175 [Candidatus Gracilibacteria bacterium]|nr:hypothetical protein [Candidatus Gracilibacteria bacterium]